jgi:hypothetical protein
VLATIRPRPGRATSVISSTLPCSPVAIVTSAWALRRAGRRDQPHGGRALGSKPSATKTFPDRQPMICLSIPAAAFEAMAATLPFSSAGFEREPDDKGERRPVKCHCFS